MELHVPLGNCEGQTVTPALSPLRGSLFPVSWRQVPRTLMWPFVPRQSLLAHYSGNVRVAIMGFPRVLGWLLFRSGLVSVDLGRSVLRGMVGSLVQVVIAAGF